jgi:hypothetical protein
LKIGAIKARDAAILVSHPQKLLIRIKRKTCYRSRYSMRPR